MMGNIISQLPADLATCEMAKTSDLERIEHWGQIFKHPFLLLQTVGYNAIHHLPAIGTDISNMAQDIMVKDHKAAGIALADLMIQNLGPVPPALHQAI